MKRVGIICIFLLIFVVPYSFAQGVRSAVVAGSFYPGNKCELSAFIDNAFDNAPKVSAKDKIIGIISPHAGYVYSGQIAADAYNAVKGKQYDVVVVIAPSHRERFSGVTIFPGDGYMTPLGMMRIDKGLAGRLTDASPLIRFSEEGHRMEHSLEVQLPFIQMALSDVPILPLVMGEQDFHTCLLVAKALAETFQDKNVLIVASTDLSHYHPYDTAVKLDKRVASGVRYYDYLLLSRDFTMRKCEACGTGPLITTMIASQLMGANKAQIITYKNSGDVSGDKSRVVGYMSGLLVQSDDYEERLTDEDKKRLLNIAKTSLYNTLHNKAVPEFMVSSGILQQNCGAFVTLNKGGNLRGCIGYIVAEKPLYQSVSEAAVSAGLSDPRFPPVTKKEFESLEFEISVLTPFQLIVNPESIEVGKHGLFIVSGRNQGVLLPQVAVSYKWDKYTFLKQVCRKAGLPADSWKDKDAAIYTFTAEVFGEH